MHILILGMTMSGKSTAAKQLIKIFRRKGIASLVFDPLGDPGFKEAGAVGTFTDRAAFLETVWNSKKCLIILDEGGETVQRHDKSMQDLFTKGRHNGHIIAVCCQRLIQIPPICRDQCTKLLLFCSSFKDGEILAQEFNGQQLRNCSRLKQGQYFYKEKFGEVQHRRLF